MRMRSAWLLVVRVLTFAVDPFAWGGTEGESTKTHEGESCELDSVDFSAPPLFMWPLEGGKNITACFASSTPGGGGRLRTLQALSTRPPAFVVDDLFEEAEVKDLERLGRGFDHAHPRFNAAAWRDTQLNYLDSKNLPHDVIDRVARLLRVPTSVFQSLPPTVQYQHYNTTHAHYYPHHDSHDLSKGRFQYVFFVTVIVYLSDASAGDTTFPFADSSFTVGRGLEYALAPVQGANFGNEEHADLLARAAEMWRRHCALPRDRRRGKSVVPKRGRAVVFYNHVLDGAGRIGPRDTRAYHGGCQVADGEEKLMLNVWPTSGQQGGLWAPLESVPLGPRPQYHTLPGASINKTLLELERWLLHGGAPGPRWQADQPWQENTADGEL